MKKLLWVVSCLYSLPGLAGWSFHSESIKGDEQIILFPAEAYPASDGKNWFIRFHGWVFEPESLGEINGVLRKMLGVEPDKSREEEKSLFRQRGRWFLVDNERGKRIVLQLGNQKFRLDLTAPNGHTLTTVTLPDALVRKLGKSPIRTHAVLPKNDRRIFQGDIHLIPENGISVISDIDDTIKISNVSSKKELLANTFLRPFQPVPDLAGIYRRWQTELDAKFHYVSASPWQLYPDLSAFIEQHGFPAGIFYMKSFRLKDSSFFNLFSDPIAYKTEIIETLFKRYPKRKFVLIGDSGEKDPEVYGAIARKYPDQVLRILIRKAGENNTSARYNTAFLGLPGKLWKVFEKPEEISKQKFE